MSLIAQIKRSQELSNLAWEMAVETAGEGYSGGSAEGAAEMQSLADGCDEAYDAAITVLEEQYQGWASAARIHLTEAKSLESDGGDASHAISALDALDEYLEGEESAEEEDDPADEHFRRAGASQARNS